MEKGQRVQHLTGKVGTVQHLNVLKKKYAVLWDTSNKTTHCKLANLTPIKAFKSRQRRRNSPKPRQQKQAAAIVDVQTPAVTAGPLTPPSSRPPTPVNNNPNSDRDLLGHLSDSEDDDETGLDAEFGFDMGALFVRRQLALAKSKLLAKGARKLNRMEEACRRVYAGFKKVGVDESGAARMRTSQSVAKWIVTALPFAHQSRDVKKAIRMLLGVEAFVSNLRFNKSWEILMNGASALMINLGDDLKNFYATLRLRDQLGAFKPSMIPEHTQRQDADGCVPLPAGVEWSTLAQEEVFIHYLRLIALAIDGNYQRAVADCMGGLLVDERPYRRKGMDAIKGYIRMLNKLQSPDDHRYAAKPRPAQNVDINRCLLAAKDGAIPEIMVRLQKRFGSFAKFKNGMALSDVAAARVFHLRIVMVSVQFKAGITFGEMCADATTQQLFKEYAAQPPPGGSDRKGVHGMKWRRQIAQAMQWLQAPELADREVSMLCEVQCLPHQFRDVRHKMHETYKVYRADDEASLLTDFAALRVDYTEKKKFIAAGTPKPKKLCRDGRVAELESLFTTGRVKPSLHAQMMKSACAYGQPKAVQCLLDHGVSVDVDVGKGWTPTMIVSASPYNDSVEVETMRLLIAAGANPNSSNHNGMSALLIGCQKGELELVQMLLANDADVNHAANNGATSLYFASKEGHADVVRAVVAGGGCVDQATATGEGPLHASCEAGHLEVVTALLGADADVDQADEDGATAMHAACVKGHVDVVNVLVGGGADVNKKNNNGVTPLSMCACAGYTGAVKALVAAGAVVDLVNVTTGMSPLHTACVEGRLDVVNILLRAGANASLADAAGQTPLISACIQGHLEVAESLVRADADLNRVNEDGRTALFMATGCENIAIVEILLRAGADANGADSEGASPLMVACDLGLLNIARVLIAAGADVNHVDHYGETPLDAAQGDEEIVSLLTANGAN